MKQNRRDFIELCGLSGLLCAFSGAMPLLSYGKDKKDLFKISLAEWSLQASLFSKKMTNMDFPALAKKEFDISIVEYVSVFFDGKETDSAYLKELKTRTDDLGVQNHLIMVDREGDLGDIDKTRRAKAVENHFKWVNVAKFLGCDKIRVNASGKGSMNEVKEAVIDGLSKLVSYAKAQNISVIVENHGGYSSNGAWLASVMDGVGSNYCGTLPDFGNFKISENETYDLYKGVGELLPYAKGISAKTFRFDQDGNEADMDYMRLFKMIKDSGFRGIVGIEWEGNSLTEKEGIMATKRLLERVRTKLS
ncbi:sugar phosphate isomerase/epimerase family protein [Pedobacter endophyticus]|uniref:TIM barrel protein n=1 Tax=Pedobacter endophyticus TaxID=2789740 RepID=A0A7S9L1S0_9SPHI|nr:sugar phosphate isomerase/epimerase family protein [Pedobacter endophyticus]QPH40887.1 TIM barrel protein [Pedobacter endophyticus]